jgi:hypothetical protein
MAEGLEVSQEPGDAGEERRKEDPSAGHGRGASDQRYQSLNRDELPTDCGYRPWMSWQWVGRKGKALTQHAE